MFVFDIESDGLLDTISKVHCINAIDRATGREYRFTDHQYYQDLDGTYTDIPCPRDGTVRDGLQLLMQCPVTAGHNIIGYDKPALQIVYPGFRKTEGQRYFDSKVASKLLYPNLKDKDFAAMRKGKLPQDFKVGSHSLYQWGQRLGGEVKSDFKPGNYINPHTGTPHTWATIPFTQDMDEYCMQDVRANVHLIEHFERRIEDGLTSWEAVWMEMRVHEIIAWQERVGVPFDCDAAQSLARDLYTRQYELEQECKKAFPPFYVRNGKDVTPKRTIRYKDKLKGDLTEGAPYTKIKLVEFNPGSRSHIARNLTQKYGWEPTEFTDTGLPKIDEDVLSSLPFAEAKLIGEFMMVQKRLSQLAEGKEAWIKKEKGGRVYGRVDPLGAVTGRMTHFGPNLAQVPANDAPYGKRCRQLFTAEEGRALVGCDADALELRVLAHFLARFDGGAYIKTVLEGRKEDGTDMHSRNQDAIGLQKRDTAKTWFYAFIYGAGNYKLGTIVMSEWDEEKLLRFYAKFPPGKKRQSKIVAIGKKSRDKLLSGLPAFGKLVEAVQKSAKRGWLKGLDGRRVPIRAMHSALNTLCQSAGALVMKQALIFMFDEFARRDLDVVPLLNVHDEVQLSCPKEDADEVGKIAASSIARAGEYFNFRCPLAGDYDVGQNWSETH